MMNHRKGLTLADLVIAVVSISLCAVLLLPAIQEIREAARLAVCEDRLVEIGTDTVIFHSTYQRIPMHLVNPGGVAWNDYITSSSPAWWGYQPSASPLILAASASTTFDIDPRFFDQENPLSSSDPIFFQLEGFAELTLQQPERYLCPAINRLQNATPEEFILYQLQPIDFTGSPNDPTNDFIGTVTDTVPADKGITNYVGCLGASTGGALRAYGPLWQYRGMIAGRELVTFEHVSNADGLANTIMFGENIGEIETENRQTRLVSRQSWVAGGVARGRGAAPFMTPSSVANPMLGNAIRSPVFGFGSFHRAGVNFLYGDGSVHRISRDIDLEPFYELCGAFDTQ